MFQPACLHWAVMTPLAMVSRRNSNFHVVFDLQIGESVGLGKRGAGRRPFVLQEGAKGPQAILCTGPSSSASGTASSSSGWATTRPAAGPLLCGEGDAEAKKHSGLTVPQTCLLVDASLPRTGSPTDPIAIVDYRRARNVAARRANPSAQGGTASTCSGNMTFRCTTKSSRLTFLLRDLDQVAA